MYELLGAGARRTQLQVIPSGALALIPVPGPGVDVLREAFQSQSSADQAGCPCVVQ